MMKRRISDEICIRDLGRLIVNYSIPVALSFPPNNSASLTDDEPLSCECATTWE